MFVTYFYNTPHRQAYVSFRAYKISISHLITVNVHIYKTVYTALYSVSNDNMFQIQYYKCSSN